MSDFAANSTILPLAAITVLLSDDPASPATAGIPVTLDSADMEQIIEEINEICEDLSSVGTESVVVTPSDLHLVGIEFSDPMDEDPDSMPVTLSRQQIQDELVWNLPGMRVRSLAPDAATLRDFAQIAAGATDGHSVTVTVPVHLGWNG